jgi:hypothetical protein
MLRFLGFIVPVVAVTIVPSGWLSAQVSVTSINDLQFDNVFQGVPKAVSKQTAGKAAEFQVTGNPGTEVTIEFSLPQYMSANGFTMQLVFQDDVCAMDSSTTPDQSNPDYDNLDPKDPITYMIGSGGITVWLGGTLIPRLGQPPGSYSAPIVITVTPSGT